LGGLKVDNKTIVAIMYDFDKTLTTKDQQEFTFIPGVGLDAGEFWQRSNGLAEREKMDRILAYMYLMLREADRAEKPISRGEFVDLGKDLEYFNGVKEWFARINEYAKGLDVIIEHYIISSGLKEIIEGSEISANFKEIFACEFYYDINKIAKWPKNVVNYTTKTQFVFRINKNVLDLSDDVTINDYTPDNERRVPFRNMIYIGDGLTDVPCMQLVKTRGGYSIAVYTDKDKVSDLILHERVNFIAFADYSEAKELDTLIKDILVKISMEDKLAYLSGLQRDEIKTIS